VERLWFLGNRRDGTGEARVAIPLGKIAQGSVRIDLPAKAVRNCPIDLATAVPTIAEVKLRPWVERLTELARRISTTAAVVLPPAPTPSVGVAYAADTSPPDFTPFETVLEQSGLRARLWGTEEGHRFLEISTDRPLASGEFVYFALLRPSGEAEPALQGYAVSSEGPDAPVAAVFKVEEVPEGAELCVALVEKGSWNEDDLPLLEWSVHHAETESLGAALEPLLAEVRKAAGAAG